MKRFLDTWKEWWGIRGSQKKVLHSPAHPTRQLDPVKHPPPLPSRRLLTNSSITVAIVAALGLVILGTFSTKDPVKPVATEISVLSKTSSSNLQEAEAYESWSADLTAYKTSLENGLAAMLNQLAGTGNVQVFITIAEGPRREFVEDGTESRQVTEEVDRQGGKRTITSVQTSRNTVKVRDSNGSDRLMTRREIGPRIQGVLVVADRGDDPVVKLEITKAISTVLGIAEYRVTVLPRG